MTNGVASSEFESEAGHLRGELLAHCYRMMGSAVEAEDQVQETYLRAWRAFHDFNNRSSVRTWMYKIATNTCLNALGSAARRVLPSGLGGPPGDPEAPINARHDESWMEPLPDAMVWQSAAPTPEEQLLARENITLAWTAALQNLPPQQRSVLLLRDVMGFSAAETAETLGLTVPAVNSTLQRAKATVGPGIADASPNDVADDDALQTFVEAYEAHDFEAVVNSLAPDASWQMPPFDRWYYGARDVARLSWRHCPAAKAGDLRFLKSQSNGQLAAGMYLRKGRDYEAFQYVVVTTSNRKVKDVAGWFDPHIFRLAGLPLQLP